MNDKELLDNLAEIEYEQWCYWSKGIAEDYSELIGLCPLEELSGGDHDFIVSQLDRLDRWKYLWDTDYTEIPEDMKKDDYLFAKKSLDVQNDTIQQLKQENMELTLTCKPLFSKRQLHEENQILKQLIKRVLETTPVEHSLALDLKNSVRELYD